MFAAELPTLLLGRRGAEIQGVHSRGRKEKFPESEEKRVEEVSSREEMT